MRWKDIATDLNLSTVTLWKVLRSQTDASEATKVRAKELNYGPNLSAGSLPTNAPSWPELQSASLQR